ncbi:rps15 (nucleomorph) [Hemiselmis andersenii]|uniref:30S ribosomal protein S15 n=1 Tax=Hemiselmis andersenii TaxID=464988 RepID=A9BL88_HEMAN|nr:rps15 [Hemiselmis andersenii]ABW98271.1 rps15 [Hemiselmis andersenii]|mmetsp:Transcript_27732/g.67599  ORF Transcript_27732/g.67599 Transcript_27732/m.67599 type:complete len:130 (+) Transcript_27732:1308-1697(+)
MNAFIQTPITLKNVIIKKTRNNQFTNVCAQISSPQPYINSKQIKEVREKYRIHEKDTGSSEYQIAALSVRIAYMTAHIKKNPKDFSSTRGLIAMVSARKKLLKYLRSQSKERFLNICVNLKIRIQKDLQ